MVTLDFLKTMKGSHGEAVAIEDAGIQITYSELATAVNALAVALQMKDPEFGSRVALCAANGPEYLVSILAIQASGKILVPVSHLGDADTLSDLLNHALPTIIIVDEQGDEAIRCDDDLKIRFAQFEGLVRTYRDHQPDSKQTDLSDDGLEASPN